MKDLIKKHKAYYWIFLILWLLLCIYELLSFLLHPQAWSSSEVNVLFYLKMLVLTFPLGYVVALIVGGLSTLLFESGSTEIFGQQVSLFTIWLAMVLIGYFQWFIWIPKLFLWVKLRIQKKQSAVI